MIKFMSPKNKERIFMSKWKTFGEETAFLGELKLSFVLDIICLKSACLFNNLCFLQKLKTKKKPSSLCFNACFLKSFNYFAGTWNSFVL